MGCPIFLPSLGKLIGCYLRELGSDICSQKNTGSAPIRFSFSEHSGRTTWWRENARHCLSISRQKFWESIYCILVKHVNTRAFEPYFTISDSILDKWTDTNLWHYSVVAWSNYPFGGSHQGWPFERHCSLCPKTRRWVCRYHMFSPLNWGHLTPQNNPTLITGIK